MRKSLWRKIKLLTQYEIIVVLDLDKLEKVIMIVSKLHGVPSTTKIDKRVFKKMVSGAMNIRAKFRDSDDLIYNLELVSVKVGGKMINSIRKEFKLRPRVKVRDIEVEGKSILAKDWNFFNDTYKEITDAH